MLQHVYKGQIPNKRTAFMEEIARDGEIPELAKCMELFTLYTSDPYVMADRPLLDNYLPRDRF